MKNITIGIMVLMSVFLAQPFGVAIENNTTANAITSMNLSDLARPANVSMNLNFSIAADKIAHAELAVPMTLNSSMAVQPANVPKTLKVGPCKSCNKLCCEYSTVQEAINAAKAGDTIEVHSGTYYEHITVDKKITLLGMNTGSGRPILDAGGVGTAIELNANGIILKGFIIKSSGNVYPDAGLAVRSSNNIIASNEVIDNGWYGIDLTGSGNELTKNTISGNKVYGLVLRGSKQNNIYFNTIHNNGDGSNSGGGIALHDSSMGNTLRNNEVFQNNPDGISVYDSNNNIINENDIENNFWNGIRVQGYSLSSGPSGNTISENDLIKNGATSGSGNNAYDTGSNKWDDGTMGNYYSDNSCTNTHNMFICDQPYSIPGGSNVDRYPLKYPSFH